MATYRSGLHGNRCVRGIPAQCWSQPERTHQHALLYEGEVRPCNVQNSRKQWALAATLPNRPLLNDRDSDSPKLKTAYIIEV